MSRTGAVGAGLIHATLLGVTEGIVRPGGDLVARDRELRDVVSLLDGPQFGLVLAGPPGVGKTRLATEAERAAAEGGFATARVVATRATSSIPFGALASLTDEVDTRTPDRLALLLRLSSAIAERSGDGLLLLVVDDAHFLDDGSAAVVHHLVQTGACRVLMTIRSPAPAPDPVTSLWKDGLARRLDLAPMDITGTEALVASTLGGPLGRPGIRWLFEKSGGNPLHLRELLLAADESGALGRSGGIWVLRLPVAAPDRLVDLVAARLSDQAPKVVDVVELLAVGEPLELDLLEILCGEEAVEHAEQHGLLLVRPSAERLVALLSNPVYGEVLRQRMPRSRFRRLSGKLATSLAEAGGEGRDDLLRIATWRLDAGMRTEPELLGMAAKSARERHEYPLAARLARAALEAGGGVEAGLALGEAEFFAGRHDEAERVLAGLGVICRNDEERAAITNARVYNLGMLMGDAAAADAVLTEALATIVAPAPRLRLLARRGIDRLFAGDLASALADSEELMIAEDRETASRGTFVRSIGLAALGLCDEAVDTAYSGFEIAKARTSGIQPAHSQLLGAVLALAGAGRLDQAERHAAATYEEDVGTGNLEGASTFGLLLGLVLIEKGRCADAARMLRESAAINREINDVPNLRFALGGLALAEAMVGHAEESSKAVDELDQMPKHWMNLLDPDLIDRGRAWSMVAAGEVSAARAVLLECAENAAGRGLRMAEAKLRHDLVRLGEARGQVDRLSELADKVDGSLVGAFVRHAEATWRRSGPELERCASEFASMGADLLAAEAYQEASEAFQRDAMRRQAASTGRLSAELRERCGPVNTPLLSPSEGAVTLTRREREVASLAASGLSSREIADRLFISVRTVDNQLQRVYNKLGVNGRDGLGEALAVH